MSWGRERSRSGYFGVSWGDYLIVLSIFFGDLGIWGFVGCCVIGVFFLPFVVLVEAGCGWCFVVVWAVVKGLWLIYGCCVFVRMILSTSR